MSSEQCQILKLGSFTNFLHIFIPALKPQFIVMNGLIKALFHDKTNRVKYYNSVVIDLE